MHFNEQMPTKGHFVSVLLLTVSRTVSVTRITAAATSAGTVARGCGV